MKKALDLRLELETPEQVIISLPLAGVGSRMAAYGADLLVRLALWLLIVIPAVFVWLNFPNYKGYSAAAVLLGYLLLQFGYYVYFEVFRRGQTPGKRQFHLRTVRMDGKPLDFTSSVLRNLLRLADWLPGFYGVGVAAMFFSACEQRLGDIAAGTVVVRERRPEEGKGELRFDQTEYEHLCQELEILHPERIRPNLSEAEAAILARFLLRLPSLNEAKSKELGERVAACVRRKVTDPEGAVDRHFENGGSLHAALRLLFFRHLMLQQTDRGVTRFA